MGPLPRHGLWPETSVARSPGRWWLAAFLAASAVLAHTLMLGPVWFPVRAAVGWIWAGVVPGALGLRLLLADDASFDFAERALLVLGLGYVSLVLGTLVLQFLPGPLTIGQVLVLYDLLIGALLLLTLRGSTSVGGSSALGIHKSQSSADWLSWRALRSCVQSIRRLPDVLQPRGFVGGLLALMFLAALFRLPNLGYSEFQGDEAKILIKAAGVIQGLEDALFQHNKGPAEILVTTFSYVLSGRINEAVARLPFAIANLGGILALLLVGRRYLDLRSGWWAAILIALNGYFVAFSRIVQYQSLVFLMSCLTMLSAHQLWRAERVKPLLVLMALFGATGLLAHYDMALMAIPAGYVLAKYWSAYPQRRRQIVAATAMAALVLLLALGLFYVPYILHPHFATTTDYIIRRAGGVPPYANFRHFLLNSTVYNSVYYVGMMVSLLVVGVVQHLSRVGGDRRWLGRGLVLFFGAAAVSLVLRPAWWSLDPPPRSWAIALFGSLLLVLLGSSASGFSWKAVLLWFAGPFVLYTFLIGDPRTHLYTMFPAWALLGGQALVQGLGLSFRGSARWLTRGALAAISLVSSLYLYWMFVQHAVEVRRTYPRYRLPIYWVPYGDRLPKVGLFGFPYRVGWKLIGALYAGGALSGDYSSNEEPQVTLWYTRGAMRCEGEPRYYVIAEHVQDDRQVPRHKIEADYEQVSAVRADGRTMLRLYERMPVGRSHVDYELDDIHGIGAQFDSQLSTPAFDTMLANGPLDVQRPASLRLGQQIEFLGYGLDTRTVAVGEPLCLTLYWRARGPIADDYKVFVHLERDGSFAAQKDGLPGCWQKPTLSWMPEETVADPYCLLVDAGASAGEYALRVGMYLPETGERLDVFAEDGSVIGNFIDLGRVSVTES